MARGPSFNKTSFKATPFWMCLPWLTSTVPLLVPHPGLGGPTALSSGNTPTFDIWCFCSPGVRLVRWSGSGTGPGLLQWSDGGPPRPKAAAGRRGPRVAPGLVGDIPGWDGRRPGRPGAVQRAVGQRRRVPLGMEDPPQRGPSRRPRSTPRSPPSSIGAPFLWRTTTSAPWRGLRRVGRLKEVGARNHRLGTVRPEAGHPSIGGSSWRWRRRMCRRSLALPKRGKRR